MKYNIYTPHRQSTPAETRGAWGLSTLKFPKLGYIVALSVIALLTSIGGTPVSAQSIGQVYTVQQSLGGGRVDFGSSALGVGFCTDYDKSAAGSGWDYTVVAASNSGLSSTTRNKVAAALEALDDGFSDSDVTKAIWHFTNGRSYSGDPVTIINRVNNGTYQPQPVIWLLPASGHLQPMVVPLTSPPTPTPTNTPTPTPTHTPTITPTPIPSATPTPVIPTDGGGSLWLDADDDGVYIPGTDAGIANVQVEVYRSDQIPGQDNPLETVTSDANGFYKFSQLTGGNYIIYIPNPPANAPLSSSVTDTADNDEDNDDNGIQSNSGGPVMSPVINLSPGQEPDVAIDGDGTNSNLTIDFGFTGPGQIDGKAWSDLDRDGIRDPNEPNVSNVEIRLIDSDGQQVTSTQSGQDGEYILPSVPVGEYTLMFITPGQGWWLTEKGQGNDDSLDSDPDPETGLTDPVEILAGHNVVRDAGLLQMQIGGYAWDDANGDGLQADSETGIGGLTIELIDSGDWTPCANENEICEFNGLAVVRYGANGIYAYKNASGSIACDNASFGDPLIGIFKSCSYQDASQANATVLATTMTDAAGQYAFDSRELPDGLLPSTSYVLRGALDQGPLGGRMPTKVNVDNGLPNADEVDSDAVRLEGYAVINFTTGADELTNTTYDFGFGIFNAAISGEVWNDLDGSGIQNPAIPNRNGVAVTLYNERGDLVTVTESANNGAYSLAQLPPDDYKVDFTPPVASLWFTLKDQGNNEALDSDVNLDSGRTDLISITGNEQVEDVDAGLLLGLVTYPPQLPNPGDQISKLNESLSIKLTAIDDLNEPIAYSASNLPPGLTINADSGEISGTPTAVGIYNASITASDGTGGVTTIAFTWTVEEFPPISCTSGAIEAEAAQLTGNFTRIVIPDGASGSQHIVVPGGSGNMWNGVSNNSALFCFNVDTPGRYRILARAKAVNDQNDSFYVTVDGTPTNGYLWDVQISSEYVADYVNHRDHADPVEIMLSSGQHIIGFHWREDGTQLDKVELELVEAGPLTVTCGGLMQEAEAGVPNGGFLTYVDPNASGGVYLSVDDSYGSNFNGGYVQDKVDFCFTVPTAGTYNLRGMVQGLQNDDSFYVKVNGLPDRGYIWDTHRSSTFVEDSLNNRYGSDPVNLYLDAGENWVTFYLREDGTKLDKIELVEVTAVQAASAADADRIIESAGEEVNVVGTLSVPSTHQTEPELDGISVTLNSTSYQAETETNHVGKYYIDDVPPGEYTVSATVPDEENPEETQTLTQSIVVDEATTEEDAPDMTDDEIQNERRIVDTVLEYQPPADESVSNDVFLPFMSIE